MRNRCGLNGLPVLVSLFAAALAQQPDPAILGQLEYRYIGPTGNRVTTVAGIPGDRQIYYAGAASGGIFKTTDGGINWKPVFDSESVSSIGSLAVSASDSNVVWVGTGEPFIRSNVSIGNGVYKSTDAGKSWSHVGLDNSGRISRMIVDPRDPEVAFACALGHAYGPQSERGVFRTTDGGETWEKTLFVDEDTGCSDLAMDPANPRILFAGMWQIEVHTWGRESGGPGSGLFMSRDGGSTWKRLEGNGLPELPVGKVAVAVAHSNPDRVYALIETGDGVPWHGQETESGELWRSDNGGETWELISHDRQLAGRTHYYSRHAVSPDNDNEVYFLAASLAVTLDGGKSVTDIGWREAPGYDHHDMWIDPTDADRMIVASDDSLGISENRGRSWHRMQLPIAQMYHVAVDNQIPYNVYGNRQDGPSVRGPSNSRLPANFWEDRISPGPIPRGMWHSVGGGESGFALPDPVDNQVIWASASGYGSVGGIVERYDERTRQARRVEIWPEATFGRPAADLRYRFNWTFPLSISPHDHTQVYAGSQYVHQTTDQGQSWKIISPDLTLNDKGRQQISGGLTPDNIGVEYAGTLFAIAESPLEKGLIWAGTNDGLVHVTRDGGTNWANVTENIPDLPAWGTVSNIEPSRYDAGTAYITVDFHQMNNRDPYVYKTSDHGQTWQSISDDIPKSMLSYAHCIREDPVRRGLLYLGTENTLYVSFNDGQNWIPLHNGLPHAPMHWLTIQEHFNDLVIGTYGRGFWILDDITPLQLITDEVMNSEAHLFQPRPSYRFQFITEPMVFNHDPSEGQNPPYGASINYYLKSDGSEDVEITILDANGEDVRSIDELNKEPGINRIWWDLRYDATTEIKLRTSPTYAPEIGVGPEGWRPFPGGGKLSVLVPPGSYTVRLTVDEHTFEQPLTLRKDPNTVGSEADIQAQTRVMLEIRDELNVVADSINQIESIRSQLLALTDRLSDGDDNQSLKTAAEELDKKLIGVEERLFQMKITGRGQDLIRYPTQLVGKLLHLADGLAVADFPPTREQLEVHEQLGQSVRSLRTSLDQIVSEDVAGFNTSLREQNVPNVLATLQE